ncbi:hypothetical protein BDW74DRAFT_147036 [Aspergillus multicolor]|uniref:uncharacterized protein n=1 Tax=Aspergillus multicolor TaxID=41759 RepID=UPI003CCE36A4
MYSRQSPRLPKAGEETQKIQHLKYDDFRTFSLSLRSLARRRIDIAYFSCVSASEFSLISDDTKRDVKSAKFSYNYLTQTLVVRMPGVRHEELISLFRSALERQLSTMDVLDEYVILGSPLTRIGNFAKEPDACWVTESLGKITLVLDTGISETSRQLAVDAHGWLESSGSSVQSCLTMNLGPNSSVTIDVWARGAREYANSPRHQSPYAMIVQHIELTRSDNGADVRGWTLNPDSSTSFTDVLVLDFELFTGRSPQKAIEKNVILDRNALSNVALRFWKHETRSQTSLGVIDS